MSVTVTEVSSFERRLTISFGNSLLDRAQTRAARRISREININGFRRGRAPRRMVENIVGKERIRHDALQDLLDRQLPDALRDHELAPAVGPSVNDVRDVEDGLEVDILISLWPALDRPPEYVGRRIELNSDNYTIDEARIADEIDRDREEFAELETVHRPSVVGDHVEIDLIVSHDGHRVEPLSISDFLLEVGSDRFLEGLGGELTGRSVGDIFDFNSSLTFEAGGLDVGTPVEVRVLVKEVYEERLPDLDDEWVADFTEFETVEEYRAAIVDQLEESRSSVFMIDLRGRIFKELLDEVVVDIPKAIIEAEMAGKLEQFDERLQRHGTSFEEYLEEYSIDREDILSDLQVTAEVDLRTRLLLDAVVFDAGLKLEENELAETYDEVAQQTDETGPELAEQLSGSVQELSLVASILRTKAMDTLLESVVAVDEDGNVVDFGTTHGEDEGYLEDGEDLEDEIERADL